MRSPEWRLGLRRPVSDVCVIVLLLAGCGSSPPLHYYRIDALEPQRVDPAADVVVLGIGRFNFPGYLQRPYMVRRGQGAEMVVDEQSRWAEPLDEAVPRVVASNIEALAPVIVVVPADRAPVRPEYRLFATVYRLDTNPGGHTELVVQWGIAGAEGETRVVPRTGRYHIQATSADDPNAMAAAISDVLAQFSRDVAIMLQSRR